MQLGNTMGLRQSVGMAARKPDIEGLRGGAILFIVFFSCVPTGGDRRVCGC